MDQTKIKRLQRLGALRDSGALTDEEFTTQKALVLGSGVAPPERVSASEVKLKRLESLRQSGALSDEEAAQEKANVLRPGLGKEEPPLARTDTEPAVSAAAPLTAAWATKTKKQNFTTPLIVGALAIVLIGGASTWWFISRSSDDTEVYVVTGVANVRTAPTTEFSSVTDTLSAGERVQGEWVVGRNNSRWLRLSGKPEAYVWEGNLRLD